MRTRRQTTRRARKRWRRPGWKVGSPLRSLVVATGKSPRRRRRSPGGERGYSRCRYLPQWDLPARWAAYRRLLVPVLQLDTGSLRCSGRRRRRHHRHPSQRGANWTVSASSPRSNPPPSWNNLPHARFPTHKWSELAAGASTLRPWSSGARQELARRARRPRSGGPATRRPTVYPSLGARPVLSRLCPLGQSRGHRVSYPYPRRWDSRRGKIREAQWKGRKKQGKYEEWERREEVGTTREERGKGKQVGGGGGVAGEKKVRSIQVPKHRSMTGATRSVSDTWAEFRGTWATCLKHAGCWTPGVWVCRCSELHTCDRSYKICSKYRGNGHRAMTLISA